MENLLTFFTTPFPSIQDMSEEQAKAELEIWRFIWDILDDNIKFWIMHYGYPVKIMQRDWRPMKGILGKAHFRLDALDLEWTEREYSYEKSEAHYETKDTTIFMNNVVSFSFIHGEETVKETPAGLPEDIADIDEKSILE